MRELLLAEVRASLELCSGSADPGNALGSGALAAAATLLEAMPDPGEDLEVAHAVGWLHWYRFLALGPDGGEPDFGLALRLLHPVYQALPEAVPAQVREFFQASEGSPAGEPPGQTAGPEALAEHGLGMLEIALRTGGFSELNQAVELLRDALKVAPANHHGRAGWLSNLCFALRVRFEHQGTPADVDAAVAAGREAVAGAAGHPDRVAMLSNLSAALVDRFRCYGALADLDAAVSASREAVAGIPDGHRDRAAMLSNLSAALLTRHGQVTAPDDLAEAVAAAQEAVRETPDGHPAQASRLSTLCNCLRTRFEHTGSRADLEAAVAAGHAAVRALPEGHPDLGKVLSNLGAATALRFDRTGDPADLDEAIAVCRDAVNAIPAGNPARTEMLLNLGAALAARFVHTGNRADLDAAVSDMREAIDTAPADHPSLATMLLNLGVALRLRYERAGAEADLEAAVAAMRRALDTADARHVHRPAMLSALGAALRSRFRRAGILADLHEAVTVSQQAVAALPDSHPDRGAAWSNLGAALAERYERTGDPADLEAAIAACRDAIDATPADQPNRAMMLTNLGDALAARFDRTGAPADLAAAITAGQQATAVAAAPHRVRAAAARRWGWAAGVLEDWPEAVRGFEAAAALLGLVAPRGLARSDQEQLLKELDGMAAQAAACCVQAGRADRAVELLEQTRGILLSQALETRTDLSLLTGRYPDLAKRFASLRSDLDRPDTSGSHLRAWRPGTSGVAGHAADRARTNTQQRRNLALAFDQLLAEIRTMPDFGGFLQPPPARELATAAIAGPVVIVNASRFGSHALILTSAGIRDPLPLDDLVPDQVIDQVARFVTVVGGGVVSRTAEEQLTEVLEWLWEAIAGPVLEYLGILGPPEPGGAWPRLWWCVPGLLSFLPLHAAGRHHTRTEACPRTVMDRVISSYTPTIRALIHARRAAAHGLTRTKATEPTGIAVVAMPHTPDAADLRGALAEAHMVEQLFPGRTDTYVGAQATYDKVTRAMSATRWAHFACHGVADPASPSVSRLLLHDHRQRPLTVAEVSSLHLDQAELAFLSACTTARPDDRLTDEAIHLASAFQLAGYRHVIGTLWPIGDRMAVKIAAAIYQHLASSETSGAAAALHAATRHVRDGQPGLPSAWAAYIHAGP